MNTLQRVVFALLLFATCTLLVPCQQAAARTPTGQATKSALTDYKQIPHVTQGEIDAIERIKAVRASLEFGTVYSLNAFHTVDNYIGGFYPLLCERFTTLFGIPFRTALYDNDTLHARIARGETSFASSLPLDAGENNRFTEIGRASCRERV